MSKTALMGGRSSTASTGTGRPVIPAFANSSGLVDKNLMTQSNQAVFGRVARITYEWGENDRALIAHALDQMQTSMQAIGATDIFCQEDDTNQFATAARSAILARQGAL